MSRLKEVQEDKLTELYVSNLDLMRNYEGEPLREQHMFGAFRRLRHDSNIFFRFLGLVMVCEFEQFIEWLVERPLDFCGLNQDKENIDYEELKFTLFKILMKTRAKYPKEQAKFEQSFVRFAGTKRLVDNLIVLLARNYVAFNPTFRDALSMRDKADLLTFNSLVSPQLRDKITKCLTNIHYHRIQRDTQLGYCGKPNCWYYHQRGMEFYVLYSKLKRSSAEEWQINEKQYIKGKKEKLLPKIPRSTHRIQPLSSLKLCQYCGKLTQRGDPACLKCQGRRLKQSNNNSEGSILTNRSKIMQLHEKGFEDQQKTEPMREGMEDADQGQQVQKIYIVPSKPRLPLSLSKLPKIEQNKNYCLSCKKQINSTYRFCSSKCQVGLLQSQMGELLTKQSTQNSRLILQALREGVNAKAEGD